MPYNGPTIMLYLEGPEGSIDTPMSKFLLLVILKRSLISNFFVAAIKSDLESYGNIKAIQ